MAEYCTLADVAAEFPWLSSFTGTSCPSSVQVARYITEAANEMEAAMVSGGHYDLDEIDGLPEGQAQTAETEPTSEATKWLKETNVQGALQRIGEFIYSYGRGGDSGRIPFQKRFAERREQLRAGEVQWEDAKVEASTKQIPALRQTFE